MATGRSKKHAFRFKIEPQGSIATFWAKVIVPKRDVFLTLKSEHVRESIKLQGSGNTQTCSMSICTRREADAFPHKVEGYIDWFYSRAFIVSRLNKNGWPSECYVYSHSDGIGKLNDSYGGQQKLLAQLEAEGGERIIHLMPPKRWDNPGQKRVRTGTGRSDGKRTQSLPRGAKLRFAVALAGAVDAKLAS